MARIDNFNNWATDVADSIRSMTGKTNKIPASEFDTEIKGIVTEPNLQEKNVEITENGVTSITPDENYKGLSKVKIITDVGSGGSNLNIFIQEEEPETKHGIWIQSSELNIDNIEILKSLGDISIEWTNVKNDAYPTYAREIGITTDGEKLYVLGGFNSSSAALNNFGYIDLTDYTYHPLANFPISVYGVSMEYHDGYIYTFGGRKSSGSTCYNHIYKYDIVNDTFTKMSAILPDGMAQSGSAIIGDYIYIFGGTRDGGARLTHTVKYDIKANTCTNMTAMPENRNTPGTCVIGTDVYIFGGLGANVLATAYKYDTVNDTYTKLSDMPWAAYSPGTNVYKGKIYIFGGIENEISIANVAEYDPITDTYKQLDNMDIALGRMTNTVIINGKIYIIGGYNSQNVAGVANGFLSSLRTGTLKDSFKRDNDMLAIVINDIVNNNIKLTSGTIPIYVNIDDAVHYSKDLNSIQTFPTYFGNGSEWIKKNE